MRFAPLAVGSVRIEPGRLALIAGPCVLEDDAMAEEVAQEVKRIAVSLGMPFVFKASFAKANRSSRESYRGPGAERGLPSLAR
ncbi:MAG TPA: 3-deoxy-8-phosphooctulonate synthase, partial [Candidatus Eisenbacteria bacterium]|nr:3-deoxy-8-phosphooctulonate synthase [Candidatus Eisenbacteria bacterium]